MLAVQRWLFTTCALFVLCPRRVYADGLDVNYTSVVKPEVDFPKIHVNPLSNVISYSSDQTSLTATLGDVEPGFDFTEDEMKNLKIWPGGVIPYYIDEFSFDKIFRDRLRDFLDATNGVTGLNFLELHRPPPEENARWVFFINRQGLLLCIDHPFENFTNEGVQRVVLGYDCLANTGELAGILLALVAVPPQHNAPDRHKYIQIVKDNIIPEKAYLFEIIRDNEWLFHEVQYDFSSAGHYSLHKYTVNGMATIKPLQAVDVAIGEGIGFSYTDIWKIRMIYNYISNKGQNTMTLPKCSELFNLGADFSNYTPSPKDEIEPRKKPNKYLGLPEDIPEDPEHSRNNKQGNHKSFTVQQKSNEEVHEDDKENIQDRDINNDSSSHNKELDDSNKIPSNKTGTHRNKLTESNENALYLMTDYRTEEELKKKKINKRGFMKPGTKWRKS